MVDFMNDPLFALLIVGVVIGLFVYFVFFRKMKGKEKEFVPERMEDTVFSDVSKRMKLNGIPIKGGRLCSGYNQIGGSIEKYADIRGKTTLMKWNPKLRQYVKDGDKSEPVPYHKLILVARSTNFIMKILSLGKEYFVLEPESVKFDYSTKTWLLRPDAELVPYGKVWINSDSALEWVNDISIKRALENMMTHTQNFTDKTSHIELAHAKFGSRVRTVAEAEKNKYDSMKKAEDTDVEIK